MVFTAVFTAISIIPILYFLNYLYQKWKLQNYILKNFSSPPRHPFKGTLPLFPKSPPAIFKTLLELIRDYGKNLVLTKTFFDILLIVTDPKDVETILANTDLYKIKKSDTYLQLKPWLGTSLLTSYGEKYIARRKIITPSFHFSILDEFVEVMKTQSDILLDQLKSKVGTGDVDMFAMSNNFALDVICETSMGVSVNAQTISDSEYLRSVRELMLALQKRFFHPFGNITFLYDRTANGKYLKQLIKVLHSFSNNVIRERRKQLVKGDSSGKYKCFLDILLQATIDGKPLSDADICEEVDTFMAGGYDTTASNIAFTLYLLARNADIQEKVYQELVEVFGSKDEMRITRKKLKELTYMDMVIKESLRIFPPGAKIGRKLVEDTIIGGVNVPAGVNVAIMIYALHHDPDNFSDPEKFDPERFNPNNPNKAKPFTYIPFSAGIRNCIGQKFATLEAKMSIAKIIMNYRLLPSRDVILQFHTVLQTSNGVHIKFESR